MLANLVLALHIALFILLGVGAVLAAAGRWEPKTGLVRLFWPLLVLTVVLAVAPVPCPLTELETWFRQKEVAGWVRADGLPQTVTAALLGVRFPRAVYSALGLALLALGLLGFWRTWKGNE